MRLNNTRFSRRNPTNSTYSRIQTCSNKLTVSQAVSNNNARARLITDAMEATDLDEAAVSGHPFHLQYEPRGVFLPRALSLPAPSCDHRFRHMVKYHRNNAAHVPATESYRPAWLPIRGFGPNGLHDRSQSWISELTNITFLFLFQWTAREDHGRR